MSSKLTFEQNLRTTAKNLPTESVPDTLSAQVMNALPAPASKRPATKWIPRLAIAGALAGATIVGAYLLPRTVITTSYAASMRQAIENAQTWHFVGSRQVNGQPVRWEVWGRRSPFLYREQIGSELLIDDGKRRVHVIPPDDYTKSPGTCLITPSEPLRDINTPSARGNRMNAGFLAGIGSENADFGEFQTVPGNSSELRAETVVDFGTDPPMRERTSLWLDKGTHLPTRYTVVQEIHRKAADGSLDVPLNKVPETVKTISELTPEYDVPVSETIAQFVSPAGYKVIDATKEKKKNSANGMVCSHKGLTLQANVVGRDAEGNIHLRFEGWLAGEPIRFKTQGLSLMLRPADNAIVVTKDGASIYAANADNDGNIYVPFGQPPWTTTDTEHPELWLAPVEPLAPNAAPRTIHLAIDAELSRLERMGNSGRMTTVLKGAFEFDIPLPAAKTTLGWDEAPASYGMEFSGVRPTFRMEKAEQRAFSYMNRNTTTTVTYSDGSQVSVKKGADYNKKRSLYWLGIVEQEARRTDNRQMLDLAQKNRESVQKH